MHSSTRASGGLTSCSGQSPEALEREWTSSVLKARLFGVLITKEMKGFDLNVIYLKEFIKVFSYMEIDR